MFKANFSRAVFLPSTLLCIRYLSLYAVLLLSTLLCILYSTIYYSESRWILNLLVSCMTAFWTMSLGKSFYCHYSANLSRTPTACTYFFEKFRDPSSSSPHNIIIKVDNVCIFIFCHYYTKCNSHMYRFDKNR